MGLAVSVPPARFDLSARDAALLIEDYETDVGPENARRWPLRYDPHGLAARSEGPWVVESDRNPHFVMRSDHAWRAADTTLSVAGGKH